MQTLIRRSRLPFRYPLFVFFDLRKSAADIHQAFLRAAAGDAAPSYLDCRFWFQWLKSEDFDVNDKEWLGGR